LAIAGESVAPAYDELLEAVKDEKDLHADESTLNNNGATAWIWAFVTSWFSVFTVQDSRASEVLFEVLGMHFSGIIHCDLHTAYQKFIRLINEASQNAGLGTILACQLCVAHLKRDFKLFSDSVIPHCRTYGNTLELMLSDLIHFRDLVKENPGDPLLLQQLEERGKAMVDYAISQAPRTQEGRAMAKRFLKHGHWYLTFIKNLDIEPTNNMAEHAIRFIVLDRYVTQGVRSARGMLRVSRLWTVAGTCRKQKRNIHQFFLDSLNSWCRNEQGPSLIPEEYRKK